MVLELLSNINTKVIYIPNPGNAGDVIIQEATIQMLNKLGIEYTVGSYDKTYTDKLLVYGGGGNLVGKYPQCRKFLINNHKNNKIVMLPQSICNEDKTLQLIKDSDITIFCREWKSYEYVKEIIPNTHQSKDMAFYLNLDDYKKFGKFESGEFFRTDAERTVEKYELNDMNCDISVKYSSKKQHTDLKVGKRVFEKFVNHLAEYGTLHTNRLHVAIVGVLLGKYVYLYPNSYYKNFEVFKTSLSTYPNIKFISNP